MYSADLNPIEYYWTWLTNNVRNLSSSFADFFFWPSFGLLLLSTFLMTLYQINRRWIFEFWPMQAISFFREKDFLKSQLS
jgi:transposase